MFSDEAQEFRGFVKKIGEYSTDAHENVVRYGGRMVVKSGSYRISAMETQEIKIRKRHHVEGRIFRFKNARSDIEDELVGIARCGVIRGYRRPEPEEKARRRPYVVDDSGGGRRETSEGLDIRRHSGLRKGIGIRS